MTLNTSHLKKVFNLSTTLGIIGFVFSMVVVLFVFNVFYFYGYVNNMHALYNKHMNHIPGEAFEKLENRLEARCALVYCGFIQDTNGKVYKINYAIEKNKISIFLTEDTYNFKTVPFNGYLTRNLDIVMEIPGNRKVVIITNQRMLVLLEQLLKLYGTLISLLICAAMYIKYKNGISIEYEKRHSKLYAESTIKSNVTEMLHHEINAPLSILHVVNDSIVEFVNKRNLDLTEEDRKMLQGLDYSIQRIETIINYLRKDKYFRHNDDNNIRVLIEHVVNDINVVSPIVTISLNISDNNKYLLDGYKLNSKLQTGQFLNTLNILIQNAIEAGTTVITVKDVTLHNNYMLLTIKDNGRGIREPSGKLDPDAARLIFDYGYTTKDIKFNLNRKKIWFKRLIGRLFGGYIVESHKSSRGIGLYMARSLMKAAGGYIQLKANTEAGVEFELKIPVDKKPEQHTNK